MMKILKKLKRFICKILLIIPDEKYLKLRYFFTFHKKLNLNRPVTYNEKLQWMKLYDHNDLYTRLVDKYEVKKIISNLIDPKLIKIAETYGVWDDPMKIDFDALPDKFVLKGTHDSGSVIICRNKKDLDIKAIQKHFKEVLKYNGYIGGREWAYKNCKPRILAEELLFDEKQISINDYKFFCFNGKVKYLFIATDRGIVGKDVKFDFFDEYYNHLDLKHGHDRAISIPVKPQNFDEMKMIAEQLSKNLRHVRVDLYEVNGQIYFGEMTFYHHSGFVAFEPKEWDKTFGDLLIV